MNAHPSVRKLVHPLAWSSLDLSKLACALTLSLAAVTLAPAAHAQAPTTAAPSRPLNVILVLRDQTRSELPSAAGYHTPALDRLAQQGITFRNHYIASAMCTPSRAALYSGQPPQVNGVFDQLESGYVPSLRKDRPNMGSMMKKLGYRTAFYGKWEMDFDIVSPKSTVNYSDALQPYGFDIYQPDGDKTGTPDQGYKTDVYRRTAIALVPHDVDAAKAFCEKYCEGDFGSNMRTRIADRWSRDDPKSALEWLANSPSSQDTSLSTRISFANWGAKDRPAATRWLKEQIDKSAGNEPPKWLEPTLPIYARLLAKDSPSEGLVWAERLKDAHDRRVIMVELAHDWYHNKDKAAAEAWLAQSSLDEEARAMVRSPETPSITMGAQR